MKEEGGESVKKETRRTRQQRGEWDKKERRTKDKRKETENTGTQEVQGAC